MRLVLDLVVVEERSRLRIEVTGGEVRELATRTEGPPTLMTYALDELPARLARAIDRPFHGEPVLPDRLEVAAELLLGSARAVREGRGDLLGPMAGDPETARLLHVLHAGCRGRLRVLMRVPGRPDRVAAWLLHDDGWRELTPGPGATSRLTRREPADLAGLVTGPVAGPVAGPAPDRVRT